MSLRYNNVAAPGEEHFHGNVKCYSKSCSQFKITDADAIVRDPCLTQSNQHTNWRSQTDPIRTEITEKKLGEDFGPDSKGFQRKK